MSQSTIINPQPPIKKRRGAPKGNLNNLKHGFYTSRFKRDELLAADKVNPSSLTDEILFVRIILRRLIDQPGENLTFQERCAAARIFFHGCSALTRVFKVQQGLGKSAGQSTLDAAIDQIAKELHLDDPGYHERNLLPPPPEIASQSHRPLAGRDEFYEAQARLIEHLTKSNDALSHALTAAKIQLAELAQYSGPAQHAEPAPLAGDTQLAGPAQLKDTAQDS